jgi:DNA (cytosine-5)-methyltransferase 1
MKILNLYACLGGNRYKWDQVTDVQVTAIELDRVLCDLYQERFPNDTVIQGDAHSYLLNHYKEFDFIWSSPPCPTHSRARHGRKNSKAFKPKYPDMNLYQEIIFLENHFKGKYCVENVIPYYEPLIPGQKRGRHIYWCNFLLPMVLSNRKMHGDMVGINAINHLIEFHEYDFRLYSKHGGKQRTDKISRNLVDYKAGQTILEYATGCIKESKSKQLRIDEQY